MATKQNPQGSNFVRFSKQGRSQRVARNGMMEHLESRVLMTAVKPNVIDIYFGYTSADVAASGSQAAIMDQINRAVAYANQAMYNSKVNVSIRLV